ESLHLKAAIAASASASEHVLGIFTGTGRVAEVALQRCATKDERKHIQRSVDPRRETNRGVHVAERLDKTRDSFRRVGCRDVVPDGWFPHPGFFPVVRERRVWTFPRGC